MTEATTEQILQIEVAIGAEAKKFLESDIGLAVVSRRDKEVDELHAKLETATPEQLPHLQLQIKATRKAIEWIIEAIDQARNSHQQLELAETED
jgi:short-subunit dehydrogenase